MRLFRPILFQTFARRTFQDSIRRDQTQFSTLKYEKFHDSWHRSLENQVHGQAVADVLEPKYMPSTLKGEKSIIFGSHLREPGFYRLSSPHSSLSSPYCPCSSSYYNSGSCTGSSLDAGITDTFPYPITNTWNYKQYPSQSHVVLTTVMIFYMVSNRMVLRIICENRNSGGDKDAYESFPTPILRPLKIRTIDIFDQFCDYRHRVAVMNALPQNHFRWYFKQ